MGKLQGRSLTAREQDIIKNGTPRQQAQKRAEQFLEDMCKRWRQESRDEYRLRFREELFNKRHDCFFKAPPHEEPPKVIHIGCAALSRERRRYHARIAERKDACACYLYLQELLERRRLGDAILLVERSLATNQCREPGDEDII